MEELEERRRKGKLNRGPTRMGRRRIGGTAGEKEGGLQSIKNCCEL